MKKTLGLFSLVAVGCLAFVGCTGGTDSSSTAGTTGTTGSASGETGGGSGAKRPAVTAAPIKVEGDTIKIGLVASQTGALQPWGIDSVGGVKLAIDEVNAAGGVKGKKIELKIEDSGSDAKQGQSATDRLISQGVVGILGEVASGITAQIAESAYKAGVPVIAIGATRTDLTDKGANIFRVCYTDDLQGPVMARFAFEELHLQKVAVLTDNQQPYSQGLSESFKKKFVELGGQIVGEEFYKSGDTQYTSQITNIKGMSPDGIFCSGYFTEVGLIARTVKEQGLSVKLLGGDGWDSDQLLANGGEGIIGGYFCNHYNSLEDRPEVRQFLTAWKAANGGKEPGTTMGALGYDAAKLICDALGRAKELDTASLITAIDETENFPGVSGPITLKGHDGNPPKRALVVEVTAKGQVFRKAYDNN